VALGKLPVVQVPEIDQPGDRGVYLRLVVAAAR